MPFNDILPFVPQTRWQREALDHPIVELAELLTEDQIKSALINGYTITKRCNLCSQPYQVYNAQQLACCQRCWKGRWDG